MAMKHASSTAPRTTRVAPRLTMPLMLSLLVLGSAAAIAQPLDAPSTDPAATQPNRPGGASLTATLVDAEKKAAKQAATVEAKAGNVKIVDPAQSGEKPKAGEGHFHYQLDGGPVVATTAPKLSWHELSPGAHIITVTLAGNDHAPISAPVKLSVRVP